MGALPAIKISAVFEILATQLTRLSYISQACKHGRFQMVIFTHSIEFLPVSCAPPSGTVQLNAQIPAKL